MSMVRATALALVVAAALTLTACASEKHATVADCTMWMTRELQARGTDTSTVAADIVHQCEQNKDKMTQEEFDRFLG